MGRCDGCDALVEVGSVCTNCGGTLVDINPIYKTNESITNYLPTFYESESKSVFEFFDCVKSFDSSESDSYTCNPNPNFYGDFFNAIESSASSHARLHKIVNNYLSSLDKKIDVPLAYVRGSPSAK